MKTISNSSYPTELFTGPSSLPQQPLDSSCQAHRAEGGGSMGTAAHEPTTVAQLAVLSKMPP